MSRVVAVEMSACRNPADARPLGKSGAFLAGSYSQLDVQEFSSARVALMAAERATNKRPGCTVETIGQRAVA